MSNISIYGKENYKIELSDQLSISQTLFSVAYYFKSSVKQYIYSPSSEITMTRVKLAELMFEIFHSLEVVSRYRDPQLQVCENYYYLFNLRSKIYKSWCLSAKFFMDICDLMG